MSSKERRASESASQPAESSHLNPPPKRPQLIKPPPRPAETARSATEEAADGSTAESAPAPEATATASPPPDAAADTSSDSPANVRPHPISPPSEPMQFRAIGLVRGTYTPHEEQFNRGDLTTEDGTVIDAVLLGRVTSLVKKHLPLEKSHLWVVYPRTRQVNDDEFDLHLQIVGVWEPENLGLPGEEAAEPEASSEAATATDASGAAATAVSESETSGADDAEDGEPLPDNYFSIRGEITKCDEETGQIIVKILQGSKRDEKAQKAFRLHVCGNLSGKTVGYFWELEVERQGKSLVLTEGRCIAIVPPKKRKKHKKGRPDRGSRKPTRQRAGKPTPSGDSSHHPKTKPRTRPTVPVRSNPL